MAGILDYVYIVAILAVGISGVFAILWTGSEHSNDAGPRADYFRAIAVAVFLLYMTGTLVV